MKQVLQPHRANPQKSAISKPAQRTLKTPAHSGLSELASIMNGSPRVQKLAELAREINQEASPLSLEHPIQPHGSELDGLHADVPSQSSPTIQKMGKEEEQVAKEEQSKEAFDQLEVALNEGGSTAVVRIAVRAKSMKNKSWKWQDVGHSSIQLSVHTGTRSLHMQAGLDNGGAVKIEGNLYAEAQTEKYDIVLLEQNIGKVGALKLISEIRAEVGKTHYYKEWMGPGSEAMGYENCSTWALKMGSSAGLSVPSTYASAFGVTPDPSSVAGRIRSKKDFDKDKGEKLIDLKYGDPKHRIGLGKPDIILGDITSDEGAAIWEAAKAILEARANKQADPSAEDLDYCFYAVYDKTNTAKSVYETKRAAAYNKAVTKANTVEHKAEMMREEKARDEELDREFYWQSFGESVRTTAHSMGAVGGGLGGRED